MAKKVFNVDDYFNTPESEGEKPSPTVQEPVVEQQTEVTASVIQEPVVVQEETPVQPIKKSQTQGSNKAIKQASNTVVKSTKHTFPIPDDLWDDVETLLYALAKTGQKKKQNQLVIELLTKEVEANKELIARYKK